MTDEGNITDADLLEQAAELAELLSDSRRCQFCGGDPYHYEDVGVAFPVPVAVVCCELGIAIHSKEPDDGLVRASGNLHQAGWLLSQAVRIAHDALASRVHPAGEPVAWACLTCNSPRSVDPCPKCGTALTKPADGWEWPGLPDIGRIRELAREVGYAVGVHGSLERDLDLIAAPWTADAVTALALAEHIAAGLGGRVVDAERQDKPCGRWACNIHTPDWTKMIDLSVMQPASVAPSYADAIRDSLGAVEAVRVSPRWSGKQADWICGAVRFEIEALTPGSPL